MYTKKKISEELLVDIRHKDIEAITELKTICDLLVKKELVMRNYALSKLDEISIKTLVNDVFIISYSTIVSRIDVHASTISSIIHRNANREVMIYTKWLKDQVNIEDIELRQEPVDLLELEEMIVKRIKEEAEKPPPKTLESIIDIVGASQYLSSSSQEKVTEDIQSLFLRGLSIGIEQAARNVGIMLKSLNKMIVRLEQS